MAASIGTTLELWASSLRDVKGRIRPLFTQSRVAASAALFLDGLLGPERRKTGWMRGEVAGDPGPWRQQALLGRGRWEADALRDVVRDYALETLADPDAVLVIDETGFLKQGKASCGVGRQYTGSAGSPKRGAFAAGITNCRIGVFAAYASRHGHAFIDRTLYLPKAWTDDPARRAAAHIPETVGFAAKPRLARAMIERALTAHVPFSWVTADTVYGVGEIEMALRRAGKGYVLGVTGTHQVRSWGLQPFMVDAAENVARSLPEDAWQGLSAGDGTKGPRLHDWAYLPLARLDADEYVDGAEGSWTRGLLIRRHLGETRRVCAGADGELAYFSAWCPAGTPIATLVAVEGRRWSIEDAFETAKNELGLDHNETRSWHGWHRHVSLVMLAFAVLAVTRCQANAAAEQTPPRMRWTGARSAAGRSRKSAALPRALHSAASARRLCSPGQRGAALTKPTPNAPT